MICPSCGAENPASAVRCTACDHVLGAPRLGPGSVIASRYEILALLGAGGMGIVYKARDRALDELVAIKVLRGAGKDMAGRFRSEVKLAWKVRHKNVCGIHEYGEDGDLLYISMELIQGEDLRLVLEKQGALLWEQAYDVALQAAEGLQAIHEAGVIHRDLKTANMIWDRSGVVRLMDFGIAKVRGDQAGQGLTDTGQVVGSPEYMSPEQIRGQGVDARSDLYAFGVVIFELFTGRVPFRGETPVTVMMQHMQDPPPLEQAQLPSALVSVLRRALAKEPGRRYASCKEMRQALAEARAALGQQLTDSVPADPKQPDDMRTRLVARSDSKEPLAAAAPPEAYPRLQARLLVSPLLRALKHPEQEVRVSAARALGRIGPEARNAAAHLVEALDDPAWEVREAAATALGLVRTGATGIRDARSSPSSFPAPESPGAVGDATRTENVQTPVPLRVRPEAAPAPVPVRREPQPASIAVVDVAAAATGARDEPVDRLSDATSVVAYPVPPASPAPNPPPVAVIAAPRAPAPVPAAAPELEARTRRPTVLVRSPEFALPPSRPALSPVTLSVGGAGVIGLLLLGWLFRGTPPSKPVASLPSPLPTTAATATPEPIPSTPVASAPVGLPNVTAATQVPAPTLAPRLATPAPARNQPPSTMALPPSTAAPAPTPEPREETPPATLPVPPPPVPLPSVAAPARAKPGDLMRIEDAGVAPPTCRECPSPEYPLQALRMKIHGVITLRVLVNERGGVVSAEVTGGPEALRESARRAVLKWRYSPGMKDGVPVTVAMPISVRFELPR